MDIVLNDKYKLIEELGEGAFGKIYVGKNINTDEKVAVKLQTDEGSILLRNEARIYNLLRDVKGVPRLKIFGKEHGINYMVIQLLGKTVIDNNNSIDVINIGIQIIDIIRDIHSRGVIHRDIKPDNILYSLNTKEQIYLIDFGLSLCYKDKNGRHISQRNSREIIGSINFISVNIHKGISSSRRDDIISIYYVLVYLIVGDLPWNINKMKETKIEKMYNNVFKMKQNINLLSKYGIHENIYKMYEHCLELNYSDEPDYDYLCRLLKGIDLNNLKTSS
mgnify:CR=1 FL=1